MHRKAQCHGRKIRDPCSPKLFGWVKIGSRNVDAQETLRFFTDGSAIHPTCHAARIASWSVVQDTSIDEAQRKTAADFLHNLEPRFPCFKVAALGLVTGEQTVARAELLALVTAVQIACKSGPQKKAEFVVDATYVFNVIRSVRSGSWISLSHKLPNMDLIRQLADCWNPDLFHLRKVKSHRSFESACDLQDLWMIAGNFCADMAAAMALKSLPTEIRQLTNDVAQHTATEEQRFAQVLDFLVISNKNRLQTAREKNVSITHTTSWQLPRCPQQNAQGLFPFDAMGSDALECMINFLPDDYVQLPLIECEDTAFYPCLQGANVAKATKLWLESLRWPHNVDQDDPSDWGISWFELAVSFYLATDFRFPVKLRGAGNKSVYAEYGSGDALLLPGHQRSAVLQSICLRNMIQNLTTVLDNNIFPIFAAGKCRSLMRLGMKSVVAGIPRRPKLPNTKETMTFVAEYLSKLTGVALDQPMFCDNPAPIISFPRIHEPSASERHNAYASFL